MKYFENIELAKSYHVSEKTIRNWINAVDEGKMDLELYRQNGRAYISNTSDNNFKIEELVKKDRKYESNQGSKVVTFSPEFYKLFSHRQILDIISSIEIHQEIPRQYNYMDGGAHNWDNFAQGLQEEERPNILKKTIELLDENIYAFDRFLCNYKRVNVIDLGVGNALPVQRLLGHLNQKKILNRYIAIDVSTEMLNIAEKNVKKWFNGEVKYEGYARDFAYERLDDLLKDETLKKDSGDTVNLALLLGGTLSNFRSPYDVLRNIYSNMGQRDLLVYTDKTDTEATRRNFHFDSKPDISGLSPNLRFIFDSLNIDDSLYDVERGYDAVQRERYIRIRLKVSLTIKLRFNGSKRNIDLNKGETILLWRARHQTSLEIITGFAKIGMVLLQASTTTDRQFILTISGIDLENISRDIGMRQI